MSNIAIFIRGIPGSGKTTLANRLLNYKYLYKPRHYEADMWMTDVDGNYNFEHYKLKYCHEQCFDNFKDSVNHGCTVIISNTFVKRWEIAPYLDHCKMNRIKYIVVRCISEFGSVHGVPPEKVFDMKMKFENMNLDEVVYDGSESAFDSLRHGIVNCINFGA